MLSFPITRLIFMGWFILWRNVLYCPQNKLFLKVIGKQGQGRCNEPVSVKPHIYLGSSNWSISPLSNGNFYQALSVYANERRPWKRMDKKSLRCGAWVCVRDRVCVCALSLCLHVCTRAWVYWCVGCNDPFHGHKLWIIVSLQSQIRIQLWEAHLISWLSISWWQKCCFTFHLI